MQYIDLDYNDKELIITLQEGIESVTIEELADDLFWEDMTIEQFGTEWTYITHQNSNTVYMLDDYGYDCFQELNNTGRTKVPASDQSYEDYIAETKEY